MQSKTTDILIIGGGVPGLALAALLGRLGAQVIVADRHPPSPLKSVRPDGRTAAIMQGSVNVLKAAGGWDLAAPAGEELRTLRIIDDSSRDGDPLVSDFEAEEIGLAAFGINMPNQVLRAALGEIVADIDNVVIIGKVLHSYEADPFGVTARFEDGREIRARLIVGADGRQSAVRKLAGIDAWERDYGQSAITCLIDHVAPHDNVSTEFHRPSGPFTLVPLPGNRSSVVWVDFTDKTTEFMALSQHALERALQERSRDRLGKIRLATQPECCPLIALRAKALTAPRTALIAEAAHVLSPLGAQGLNLSLRDAAALAEVIADAMRAGLDPGSAAVLDRYARRRRRDVLTRVAGTDGLTRMVSNNDMVLRGLRRAGLKALNSITPLREMTMQAGLAPNDADSRLARGEAL